MNAFITGSHAYGTPREDSDVDLVVLVDDDTIAKLTELNGGEVGHSGGPESASLRFGALNLILHSNPAMFEAWQAGTASLKRRKPVTRDEAVALIKALMAVAQSDAIDELLEQASA